MSLLAYMKAPPIFQRGSHIPFHADNQALRVGSVTSHAIPASLISPRAKRFHPEAAIPKKIAPGSQTTMQILSLTYQMDGGNQDVADGRKQVRKEFGFLRTQLKNVSQPC